MLERPYATALAATGSPCRIVHVGLRKDQATSNGLTHPPLYWSVGGYRCLMMRGGWFHDGYGSWRSWCMNVHDDSWWFLMIVKLIYVVSQWLITASDGYTRSFGCGSSCPAHIPRSWTNQVYSLLALTHVCALPRLPRLPIVGRSNRNNEGCLRCGHRSTNQVVDRLSWLKNRNGGISECSLQQRIACYLRFDHANHLCLLFMLSSKNCFDKTCNRWNSLILLFKTLRMFSAMAIFKPWLQLAVGGCWLQF